MRSCIKQDEKQKDLQTSDISLELIAASSEEGTQVSFELCETCLDEVGLPAEWVLNIVVPIFTVSSYIVNSRCYRAS